MTILSLVCLRQCKLGIVKFIEAEQVPEVETVVHLVVASSDTRHSVATAADLELKSKQRWVDVYHRCARAPRCTGARDAGSTVHWCSRCWVHGALVPDMLGPRYTSTRDAGSMVH